MHAFLEGKIKMWTLRTIMNMYEVMYLYQVGMVQEMGCKRKYEEPLQSKYIICLYEIVTIPLIILCH